MEFGMFHEFPSMPGRSETETFDEAMAQIDAAERWGLDVDVAGRNPFRARAHLSVVAARDRQRDRRPAPAG